MERFSYLIPLLVAILMECTTVISIIWIKSNTEIKKEAIKAKSDENIALINNRRKEGIDNKQET